MTTETTILPKGWKLLDDGQTIQKGDRYSPKEDYIENDVRSLNQWFEVVSSIGQIVTFNDDALVFIRPE